MCALAKKTNYIFIFWGSIEFVIEMESNLVLNQTSFKLFVKMIGIDFFRNPKNWFKKIEGLNGKKPNQRFHQKQKKVRTNIEGASNNICRNMV